MVSASSQSALAGLATDQWKYIRAPRVELYDRRADPEELHNLAGDPDFAAVREQMHKRLVAMLEKVGDPEVDTFRDR